MVSNSELARRFAAGETKGKGSHMFIEGDTIYSYGYHFPVARRTPQGMLFNSKGYSSTTARHKRLVGNAIGGNYIEVIDANIANTNSQFKLNQQRIAELQEKQRRARAAGRKQMYANRMNYLQQQNERMNQLGW